MAEPKRKNNVPGDRFTVLHNKTSKEKIEYVKDILGLSNTSQVVHMAINQYYRAVKEEQETRRSKVSNVG